MDGFPAGRARRSDQVMQQVLLALLPGIAALLWYFGAGVLIQVLLACAAALGGETLALRLRNLPVRAGLGDGSTLLTGVLLGIALPPLAPWWLAVSGGAFAMLVVKHPFGGLGNNLFNPAMAAYAMLLVSFPDALSRWPMLRAALKRMGRADLIGNGAGKLVPSWQPAGTGVDAEGRRKPGSAMLTQHTGLPRTPGTKPVRTQRNEPARAGRPDKPAGSRPTRRKGR